MAFLAVAVGSDSTAPLMVVGWTLNYELFFYTTVALTVGLFGDR
jgi:peptidoglycan/LPS O-acetylase OafA/YrhL